MKKTAFILVLIILITLLCSCSSLNKQDLKFYVIPRININDGMSDREIINEVKENGRLVFDGEDLMGYNWQNHTVILTQNAASSIGSVTSESGGSFLFKVDDSYAFALILGNKLIYTGGFKSGAKNPNVPLQPYINDESRYTFSIQFDSKYADYKDNRSDRNLYKFLELQGLLTTKLN